MNTENIVIDRVTDVVLKCRDDKGNCFDIIYGVDNDAGVFVTLETRALRPGINIKAGVKTFTITRNETEDKDLLGESSEELDKFLEQYNKCAIMPLHN